MLRMRFAHMFPLSIDIIMCKRLFYSFISIKYKEHMQIAYATSNIRVRIRITIIIVIVCANAVSFDFRFL